MKFETVYKIGKIGGLPQDEKDNVFLTEKERDKLIELIDKAEKYKQLFFLKESSDIVFDDFPALGAWRSVFNSSSVKGPFVSPPEIKEKTQGYCGRLEYDKVVFKKFIPLDRIPASFEEVELVNYGTRTSEEYTSFIIQCDHKLNKEKIIEVRNSVIKKLEETYKSLQKSELLGLQYYKGLIDNCTVEFRFSGDNTFHYPNVNIKVFGLKGKPREVIRALGLSDLENAFGDRDIGLEHWVKEGLAYDFLIQKNLDIGKLLEAENIII